VTNGVATARRWIEYLASRKDLPLGSAALEHFEAGTITRICDCGCNSFDLSVPNDSKLQPLIRPSDGRSGAILTVGYHTGGGERLADAVEFVIFADVNGYLSGIDVEFCGNSAPMPEDVVLIEPPFLLQGALLG
jgi:hypothetical protein